MLGAGAKFTSLGRGIGRPPTGLARCSPASPKRMVARPGVGAGAVRGPVRAQRAPDQVPHGCGECNAALAAPVAWPMPRGSAQQARTTNHQLNLFLTFNVQKWLPTSRNSLANRGIYPPLVASWRFAVQTSRSAACDALLPSCHALRWYVCAAPHFTPRLTPPSARTRMICQSWLDGARHR